MSIFSQLDLHKREGQHEAVLSLVLDSRGVSKPQEMDARGVV